MAIPAAVKAMEERAMQAHREAYQKPADTPAAQVETPPVTPPAPPQVPGNTAPAAPQAPQAGGLPTGPAGEDHKQKFEVLQGKYNAEVPRLHAELREVRALLAAAQAQISALQNQPPSAPVQGKTGDSDVLKKVRDEFGDELADGLLALIESKSEEKAAKIRQEFAPIAERVNTVETRQVMSAGQRFLEDLRKEVPKFDQLNGTGNGDGHPEFLTWLGSFEPYAGKTYQTLLEDAHSALDVQRAARIIKAWPGYAAYTAPPAAPALNPQVESLIDPGPSRPNTQPTAQKPTYTQEMIKVFYDEVRRGLWRTKEKERAAKDADIALASKEGRIVG